MPDSNGRSRCRLIRRIRRVRSLRRLWPIGPGLAMRLLRPIGPGLLLLAALGSPPAQAASYVVGPGQPYPEIGDVPWESLAPGDSVRIHAREADYHEKWVICRQGTAADPIVVQGIPAGDGSLPVINGIDATTRDELNYWNEDRGIIKIGGANHPLDTMPAHILIENLEIRSGRPPYTFTGRYGVGTYAENSAAIYIEKGEHVRIRGCRFWDCGNGLFCGYQTGDLVVEHNHIYGNGIEGSIYQHNAYTEALGILYAFNYFGPLRADCPGNNLKDRSAGCVVRYNWIEGGNRQLDLVDSGHQVLYDDPLYRETFVYGNVLIEPDGAGNSQILHYGGDSGVTERYRKGTLYFHHNTMVSTRLGNTTLARLSTNEEFCDARNNVLFVSADGDRLAMLAESGGILELRSNWLKPGWVESHGGTPGEVIDYGNVEGADPGFWCFGDQSFWLTGASACIDQGVALAELIAEDHRPVFEYVKHAQARERFDDGLPDIGAYEFNPGSHVGGGILDDQAGDTCTGAPRLRAYPTVFRDRLTIVDVNGAGGTIVGADGRVVWTWPAAHVPRQGQALWHARRHGQSHGQSHGKSHGRGQGHGTPFDPSLAFGHGPTQSAEPSRIQWQPGSRVPPGIYYLRTVGDSRSVGQRVLFLSGR